MQPDGEESYELVYPFICTVSNGGQWDDEAFVAGAQFGELVGRMRSGEAVIEALINPDLAKQVDLAAMHHGYSLLADDVDDSWIRVNLVRQAA